MLAATDLRNLARARLTDAEALLRAGRLDGAAYLCGYVVELALKARICRTLRWPTFPQTRGEFDGLQSFKTQDLDVLLHLGEVMRDLAEKLRGLERAIADEKGPFSLFALFLREGAPNVWDLVVAAAWMDEDWSGALAEISRRVQAYLRPSEITNISRVVIVETTNPALKVIASAGSTSYGVVELANRNFFGLEIKRAFIITAQLNPSPTKASPRTAASGGRR